tara:strand:- start:529 stop:942 length:414 start_codon:yes stop_codon:yes gene_type:complete
MNFYKLVTIVAFTAGLAQTVHAADLGSGISLNTELKAFHKVDAETNHVTVEPELRWTPAAGALSLYSEMPITMYETNHASGNNFAVQNILEDGNHPLLEMGVEYTLNTDMMLYGETTYNFNGDGKRGEIELGLSFSF